MAESKPRLQRLACPAGLACASTPKNWHGALTITALFRSWHQALAIVLFLLFVSQECFDLSDVKEMGWIVR